MLGRAVLGRAALTSQRRLATKAGTSLLNTGLALHPARSWTQAEADQFRPVGLDQLFSDQRVALFAVPGAFTPTCSGVHVPGYVAKSSELRDAGVDRIVCVSVNDPYCLDAWARGMFVEGKVDMFADPDGSFTRFMGQENELSAKGLSPTRSMRYSMLVENGTILEMNVEPAGGVTVSDAETMKRCVHRHKPGAKGYVF